MEMGSPQAAHFTGRLSSEENGRKAIGIEKPMGEGAARLGQRGVVCAPASLRAAAADKTRIDILSRSR